MIEEFRGMGYLYLQIGNIIIYGGPWETVPELPFEKKGAHSSDSTLLVCRLRTRDLLLMTPHSQTSSHQQGDDC